jgi:hypothetical protein
MPETTNSTEPDQLFDPEKYAIKSFDDELRVDKLCKELLKQYHHYLLNNKGIHPLKAGSHASGADYFLRDFMIDNRRTNITAISPDLIHSFAGNWYIINTLEPNLEELSTILLGINHFYRFCAEKNIIPTELADSIQHACSRTQYYRERIESFHTITGDGYMTWNNSCPL